MDQKLTHFERRHAGELAHLLDVAHDAGLGGLVRRAVFVSGGAARQYKRCGHALQVPLKWAANGFVEVVDVEDEAAIWSGVGAEIAHVRIAAELADDAGGGEACEVGSHDWSRSSKIPKRRPAHELILEANELRHAAAHGSLKKRKCGDGARFAIERLMVVAADLLAPRLSDGAPFLRGFPLHHGRSRV